MFEFIEILNQSIEDFFNSVIDSFVELAVSALDSLGISDLWNDLLQTEAIGTLLSYAPLADKLVNWSVVSGVIAAEFAILIALVTFKIIVKAIPTVW